MKAISCKPYSIARHVIKLQSSGFYSVQNKFIDISVWTDG